MEALCISDVEMSSVLFLKEMNFKHQIPFKLFLSYSLTIFSIHDVEDKNWHRFSPWIENHIRKKGI